MKKLICSLGPSPVFETPWILPAGTIRVSPGPQSKRFSPRSALTSPFVKWMISAVSWVCGRTARPRFDAFAENLPQVEIELPGLGGGDKFLLKQFLVQGRRLSFDFAFAAHFWFHGPFSILEMSSKRIIFFIRIPGGGFQSRFGMGLNGGAAGVTAGVAKRSLDERFFRGDSA